MNKILLAIVAASVFVASCNTSLTVQKRQHSNGYYVSVSSTDKKAQKVENTVVVKKENSSLSAREVAVANAAAVSEVSAALAELEANPMVDVIIITRGGGSFEDLLPFSDESLLRLVAQCQTPIVSAIGHEKDSPLLDLVADWRASTPTDAGKRVVPDMEEELTKISSLKDRANRFIQSRIEFELSKIKGFMERQVMREPQTIVTTRVEIINGLVARSHRSMSSAIAIAVEEIGGLRTQVRTLSPQATLDRGYSVVQKADGSVLRKASEVKSGEKLRLRLAQGEVGAITE